MPRPSTEAQVEHFTELGGSLEPIVWLDDDGLQVDQARATMARLTKRAAGKGLTSIHVDVGDLQALAARVALPEELGA